MAARPGPDGNRLQRAHTRASLLAGLLATAIAGCSSTVVDLGTASGHGSDYMQGAVYVLLHGRYLDQPQPWTSKPLVIVASPHSYPYGEEPKSMDEYRADPGRWPKIRGIVPAGTRIRLDRIEHRKYPGLEDWFVTMGVIESGEFIGHQVNIDFISSGVPGSRMWRVNPEELQREVAEGSASRP